MADTGVPPRAGVALRAPQPWRRRLVSQPFFAAAERSAALRLAEAAPPLRPPLRDGAWFSGLPRPEPDFLPPPVSLLTVAQARRSASFSDTPRSSYPSSICSA